jgi:outer membrane receptor protein involved in Fe transport
VNLPVIDNRAAILISAYDRVDPGFISDDGRNAKEVDETRTRGARVAFLATPIDGLSIKAAAIGQNRSADGFAAVDSDPLTLQPLYGDYQQRRGAGSEYFRNEYRLYYLTVAYDFGWAQFTETTSYNTYHTKSSQDYTQAYGGLFPPPYDNPDLGIAAVYEIPQNKLTQEVRLSGNVHSLEWVIGGYFDHENSDTVVTLPTYEYATGAPVDLPGLLYADTIGHYFGKAIFGQLTYQFTRQFGVTVGGRYAKDEANSTATTSGALVGPESVVYASSEDTATTYTFAPTYKITDNLTAYARVATGFRPGGSNPGYAPEPTFGPDKVTNYEAGLKGDFLDHRVSFEADGFHVDWSGVQLQLRNDQGLGYTANAGKAGSNGFEGSLAYSPVNALTFRATATYTDAKLDRDILTGGNIYGLSGDPLPYSPPWKVAVSGDYTTPISGNWSAFAGASFFYTDRVAAEFATSANAPRLHFPSYETVDARLGVTRRDWTLSLIAKNLFDERGFNGQVPLTLNPTGATALSIIQPRSVLLSLSYSH